MTILYVVDERRYYAELDDTHARGAAVGIAEAADHLMQRATEAFANDKDDDAGWLRDLARELRELAAKRKPGPCLPVGALPIASLDDPDAMEALRVASEEYV